MVRFIPSKKWWIYNCKFTHKEYIRFYDECIRLVFFECFEDLVFGEDSSSINGHEWVPQSLPMTAPTFISFTHVFFFTAQQSEGFKCLMPWSLLCYKVNRAYNISMKDIYQHIITKKYLKKSTMNICI